MSENHSIRTTTARNYSPNKFADLHNSVGHELMQLHTKLAKYIQKHRVRRYAKANSEKVLEHNCLIFLGNWNGLYAWQPGKSLWEKAKGILEIQDATSHDFRLPEIITHASKGSFRPYFHMTTIIESIPTITGIVRCIIIFRHRIPFGGSLCRGYSQLINESCIPLLS
jgi:hypothetical protein